MLESVRAIPLKGVGDIRFGMDRRKVRERLGNATEFKKTKMSGVATDDFGWCHVFYNGDGKCIAIEIFDRDVYVGDVLVFPTVLDRHLTKVFPNLIEDEDDIYISRTSSVGIYAPNNTMESILFATPHYYG